MIYYTAKEIIRALIYSFGFGAFLGVFAIFADVAFDFFITLFHMLIKIKSLVKNRKESRAYFKSIRRLEANKNKRLVFIKDLLFSSVTGFLFSFLFYMANDGEIRIFVVAAVLISFLLCKKTFGRLVGAVLNFILVWVLKLVMKLLMLVLVPLCLKRAVL